MSATNYFENALLKLIFNATAIDNVAQNNGTSPATQIFLSLHTADPGEAGTQTTSETNYTSYTRVGVVRTTAGWTVTNNVAANASNINFPAATGGSSTVTHYGIGLSSTGAGTLLFKGTLDSSLGISNGITPSFSPGDLTVTAE